MQRAAAGGFDGPICIINSQFPKLKPFFSNRSSQCLFLQSNLKHGWFASLVHVQTREAHLNPLVRMNFLPLTLV